MIRLIAVISILSLAISSHAQTWVYCCTTKQNDTLYFRSDVAMESFNTEKDSALKVWTKRTQKELTIQQKVYFNAVVISLNYIDCKTNKFVIISGIFYDEGGNAIGSYDDGKKFPNLGASPESLYEKLIDDVCQFYIRKL